MNVPVSLAEVLLETAGFAVSVRSLEDLVQTALGAQWRDVGSDDENAAVCHPHQYIMEVTRRS
jgi:hypothetical protein